MNAVEIEQAISNLAEQPFNPTEFPYLFLEAFGNKTTTITRLKSGNTNKTDLDKAVLQSNNIHIAVCDIGNVDQTLEIIRNSPATTKHKAKFILATDGDNFQAEDLISGETIACHYSEFPDHFGFFLALAGISTVKEIRDNAFDIKATSRLNRLYLELLKDNPLWAGQSASHDMNHFMARLIFCFFAEDTNIFIKKNLFTQTVEQMSDKDSSNTHEIMSEIFRAMNVKKEERETNKVPRWANDFPYVNGGLFSGGTEVPRFSKIARSYLLHVGNLDWTKINPDIFGSMIQAVTDEEERSSLGMHYTSVPNILKVLNPLFLNDLRYKLEKAGDSRDKLRKLRERISKIRVFDPACGSGNFLVIAYREMREIEAEINYRLNEPNVKTAIPLTNFRGIELRAFPAEIARLALIIAEYQNDVKYRGETLALEGFLPLDAENWITCGNALRLDWLKICPPTGKAVSIQEDGLFKVVDNEQAKIEFENEGGETYICGNPPYKGSNWRTKEQTNELEYIFSNKVSTWKALDYVAGWFVKASEYSQYSDSSSAFVATNSICQGVQASILWKIIFNYGQNISFAYTSFKWSNLASHNAGVSVIIVGITSNSLSQKKLFETDLNGEIRVREVGQINAYLLNAKNVFVEGAKTPLGFDAKITDGSGALDGGNLIIDEADKKKIVSDNKNELSFLIKPYLGSSEFIRGNLRWCLWIEDDKLELALKNQEIFKRVNAVLEFRKNAGTRAKTAVGRPHKFAWINKKDGKQIIIPTVFSEKRQYITAGYLSEDYIINNAASIVQKAELYVFAIISSKLHISWVQAVAGKLEDRIRYTATTCYNTFPIPQLTEKNKADLTRCAEDILLAREVHFPATIADLYDPEKMPENLRNAHERNDEVLERIYIGRRFKNDTERLEKLFDLYTQMTEKQKTVPPKVRKLKNVEH